MIARHGSYAVTLLLTVGAAWTAPAQHKLAAQEAPPSTGVPAPATQRTQPPRPVAPTRPSHAPQRVALEIASGGEPSGTIVVELEQEKAPISVRNFLRYVDEGFYNGTIFHRVLPGYVIQGGGYTGVTQPKTAGLHEAVANEARNQLKNTRGTIALARGADPHSAKAQFFINLTDNPKLDHPSRDGWGYCVFGRVVEGLEVVDRIAGIATESNPQVPGENSQPVDPPVIKQARRLAAGDTPVSRPAPAGRKHAVGGGRAPEPPQLPESAPPPPQPPSAEPPPVEPPPVEPPSAETDEAAPGS